MNDLKELTIEILQHVYKNKNECDGGAVEIPNLEGCTSKEMENAINFCENAGYLEVVAKAKPLLDGVVGNIKLTKRGEDYLRAQLREREFQRLDNLNE